MSHFWGVGESSVARAYEIRAAMGESGAETIEEILEFFSSIGIFLDWPEERQKLESKYRRHKPKNP